MTTDAEPPAPRQLPTPRVAILPITGTTLLHGTVTVTRAEDSPAFEPSEIADIETCIMYAALAAEVVIRLEAERAALRTQQERVGHFHRTMLSVVGHDMRAPVAAILIGTEMLVATHQDDPSLAGVVNRIVSFANRISRMVDQLIDLSRSRLGDGIPLARSKVRLGPLLESVIEDLKQRYPHNRFSLSGDADLKGVWDPDRLRQVTASLIRNAVQHGLKDGPIDVVMSQDETGTNFAVHNEVCDDPIPPEAVPELFDPYRDLGLYIVREIVEAHGGRVAVDSSSDGTTFRVLLPA